MTRLRGLRLLALLLLLGVPGLGGSALQLLHPCPASAPWLADAAGGARASHRAAVTDASGHEGHAPDAEHRCHCIGSCQLGTAPLPAGTAVAVLRLPPEPAPRVIATAAAVPPAARPADRLPPSTAPPRA